MTEDTDSKTSSLFQGKQFWLSQNIPQRSRFKELITSHGGIVRLQEKDADVKLVDHTKKNLPADTYSYKYIEDSIRNGKLANLESHRVGPSAHRPVGATYIPTRGKKILYSLQDDQTLWDWVQQYEGVPGYPIGGNKIYQELAAKNPRHTYQSYRDRYLKRLRGKPRPGGMEGFSVQKAPEILPQHFENRASTEGDTTSISKDRPRPEEPASRDLAQEKEAISDIPESARQRTPTHTEDAQQSPEKDIRKRKRLSSSSSTAHQHSPQASETEPKRRRYSEEPEPEPDQPEPDQPEPEQPEPEQPEPEQPEPEQPEPGPENPTEQTTATHNKKEPIETNDPEVDGLLRQLPFWPSSPAPEPEPDEDTEGQADEGAREKNNPVPDIDEWIDDCIRTGKAHSDKQVIEALRCTTMDPDLAQTVLKYLVAGKDIPDDIPGVWTAEDDEHLEGGNARYVERVLEKHGDQYVESRGEYLGLARATGLAGTDD